MARFSLRPSVITRLVLGYGVLLAISFIAMATVFYWGTIGVLNRGTDRKIESTARALLADFHDNRYQGLASAITRDLTDGIDSDSEIYLAVSAQRTRVAGNIESVADEPATIGQLVTRNVTRNSRARRARLLATRLPDGGLLLVGRDLSEQQAIQALVWEALASGAAASIILGLAGATLFRTQINSRIAHIRLTAKGVEAGDLSRRIPVPADSNVSGDDEFGLLNRDINRMLDRIEQLMSGIRHVSDAIAHDLRTPLASIRAKLDDALRADAGREELAEVSQAAMTGIDDLILVFEKLLYIAQAESGMRGQLFERVDLSRIANDMVELYDATAEEHGTSLALVPGPAVHAHGDRNLLGSAVANLIDNAIKHAGRGARVEVRTCMLGGAAALEVRDNGPGIPQEELHRVTERFYRLDRSRGTPGNGLGLATVAAIANFHGGALRLTDDGGLVARIVLAQS
jgi:signal transduction histidine kinase